MRARAPLQQLHRRREQSSSARRGGGGGILCRGEAPPHRIQDRVSPLIHSCRGQHTHLLFSNTDSSSVLPPRSPASTHSSMAPRRLAGGRPLAAALALLAASAAFAPHPATACSEVVLGNKTIYPAVVSARNYDFYSAVSAHMRWQCSAAGSGGGGVTAAKGGQTGKSTQTVCSKLHHLAGTCHILQAP